MDGQKERQVRRDEYIDWQKKGENEVERELKDPFASLFGLFNIQFRLERI